MRRPAALIAAAVAAAAAIVPLGASAAPTCTIDGTEAACGLRVVAEPYLSATFLQFGLEAESALRAIERINPDIIEVKALHEWTGDDTHRSADGLPIWVARVTDESVASDEKVQVALSLSVHGNESAGREGGIRYLEDMARWSVDDPGRQLYAGDTPVPLSDVLQTTEVWFGFTNPDGWAGGDIGEVGTFARGNARGVDLNREFPTTGWTNRGYTPMSEPEAIGWVELVGSFPELKTATDIHGELTSATDSFADLMWPAGQWTPRRQAQEFQFAQHMERTIDRYFQVAGMDLEELTGQAGIQPATFATAYDIVGYDDSGFMGDWFVTQGAVEIDVENLLSHLVPSNVWNQGLETMHVQAVRGIIEATIAEALITDDVEPALALGDVAYVHDPAIVSSTDDDGFGFQVRPDEQPEHYDVTRMRYFEDLEADAGVPVDALAAADIAAGADLSRYDSIVLSDAPYPADTDGRDYDPAAYRDALLAFADAGGQLVLTDGAVTLLADAGIISEGDIEFGTSQAGHVEFGDLGDHPWERDLRGLARQTYMEVPLGYPSGSSTRRAPHHGVATAAWEAIGGTTVGTSLGFTTLGELGHGAGKIAVFGAILPTQSETDPHLFGLADYAVSVAGGQVLHTMLEYGNDTITVIIQPAVVHEEARLLRQATALVS